MRGGFCCRFLSQATKRASHSHPRDSRPERYSAQLFTVLEQASVRDSIDNSSSDIRKPDHPKQILVRTASKHPLTDGWEWCLLSPGSSGTFEKCEKVFIGQYGSFARGELNTSPYGEARYRLALSLPEQGEPCQLLLTEVFSACEVRLNSLAVRQLLLYSFLCFFTLGAAVISLAFWNTHRNKRLYLLYGLMILCIVLITQLLCGAVHSAVHRLAASLCLFFCTLPPLTGFLISPMLPQWINLSGRLINLYTPAVSIYLIVMTVLGLFRQRHNL